MEAVAGRSAWHDLIVGDGVEAQIRSIYSTGAAVWTDLVLALRLKHIRPRISVGNHGGVCSELETAPCSDELLLCLFGGDDGVNLV